MLLETFLNKICSGFVQAFIGFIFTYIYIYLKKMVWLKTKIMFMYLNYLHTSLNKKSYNNLVEINVS